MPWQDECIDKCGGDIKVAVTKFLGGQETKLYETDQRNLFSKYADRR
jgi:hypothetical protein